MKATQKDFARLAPNAARQARVFFLCGPDEAGAAEAARILIGLLDDPGERIDLSGADLRRDSVRLGDEARSTSLFGGRRHILVRAAGDEAHDAVEILLANAVEPCPVVIVATGATDKSRTAKLLADRKDALVAMFWPPELRDITAALRSFAEAAGLRIGPELLERIARSAGMDIRLAQSEVTKLALYLDASPERTRSADTVAFDAVGAASEDDDFMPLVNAAMGGDRARLPAELRRLREQGLNPVGVLLAFERRAAQLAGLAAKLGGQGDARALIESEKAARRVFWKDADALTAQLRIWQGSRLGRLVERLAELHRALLTHSQEAELLVSQGISEICRQAASTAGRLVPNRD